MQEGQFCYIAKSDMKSALRTLGIRILDFCLLLMKAKSPIDGKINWSVDKCLPFSGAISCSHYQRVSNALAHLAKYRSGKIPVNYLDDSVFVALLKKMCDMQVSIFLEICNKIGLPVSLEKTFWGAQVSLSWDCFWTPLGNLLPYRWIKSTTHYCWLKACWRREKQQSENFRRFVGTLISFASVLCLVDHF